MSSMRSASSSTRVSTSEKSTCPCVMRSIRRPGVAMTISVPARTMRNGAPNVWPAFDGIDGVFNLHENKLRFDVDRGHYRNFVLRNVSGRIEELGIKGSDIVIEGSGRGPLADLLDNFLERRAMVSTEARASSFLKPQFHERHARILHHVLVSLPVPSLRPGIKLCRARSPPCETDHSRHQRGRNRQ